MSQYWLNFFERNIKPEIQKYTSINYSTFKDGDFGNLTRISFEAKNILVDLDFWSNNVLDITIFDKENPDDAFIELIFLDKTKEAYILDLMSKISNTVKGVYCA